MDAKTILQSITGHEVMIVGDVMLDRYLTGSVSRISPEAPVPVVLHQKTEDRLGGAANVALNIVALGSRPVLCSVIGNDVDGDCLLNILPECGISTEGIVRSEKRKTTVKTRILGNHQQMLRIDSEDTFDLEATEQQDFIQRLESLMDQRPVRVMILQDYNKGVLSAAVIGQALRLAHARNIITVVDPKKSNFFAYQGVDLFKPNLKEIRDSVPFSVTPDLVSLEKAAAYLREKLGHKKTMITLSEKGLYLDNGSSGTIYPTVERNISDVSGAGDTVISILALALVAGLDAALMATLSNLAGGQVCEYPGVVPVKKEILEKELDRWLASRMAEQA